MGGRDPGECLHRHAQCQPIRIGDRAYVPLDIDVSPFDHGKTQKEGVSRTYKGCDGYAPIFAYLESPEKVLGSRSRQPA